MAEREIRRMTVEEFLAWDPGDDERYELVDGFPRAMTGARRNHDTVVVNALVALKTRLRGRDCSAHTSDMGVVTGPGRLRRPDVTVDCGPRDARDKVASEPVVLIEVLSESTRKFDKDIKALEYMQIASVRQILLIDPDDPSVLLHERRPGDDWRHLVLIGRDTEIDLWSIGLSVPLSDFYDGIL